MSRRIAYRGLASFAVVLASFACQSEQTEPIGKQERLVTTYDVPISISLSASVESEARALDFVVYDEVKNGTNNTNPHLELEQFQRAEGMPVSLIFVRTDDPNTPISVVTTTLKPEVAFQDQNSTSYSPIPPRTPRLERYLRTKPGTGNDLTLATGSNLREGTWKVAVYVGDGLTATDRSITIDPNRLEQVKPVSDLRSDWGIDDQYTAGHSNLVGIEKSNKGQTTLRADQKASLAIPYLSQWQTIEPSMLRGDGSKLKLNLGRITLRPQGMLLRIQVRNKDFDPIKLAGFRLLTNSLAFRGAYDFSDANLRTSASATDGDISNLFTEKNALGMDYADSIYRTQAYPNYADFWVDHNKAEELSQGQDSKYYLVWATPVLSKDATNQGKSRQGILHVLLYDAKRTSDEYNRAMTGDGYRVVPKALIRKPALTYAFPAGHFRRSNGKVNAQYFRLHGVQTKVYNFLDFMIDDDDQNYHSQQEMLALSLPSGQRVAEKQDWAGIFPVKLPDNPTLLPNSSILVDHYYMGIRNEATKYFNSNRLGYTDGTKEQNGTGEGEVMFIISSEDKGYTPQVAQGIESSKAGKSNNKQRVRIPRAMQIPVIRGGNLVEPVVQEIDLHFSVYQSQDNNQRANRYALVGWDEAGGAYLSGVLYRSMGDGKVQVTSRYMGPALHSPYGGSWEASYPWDITFYYFGIYTNQDPRVSGKVEKEDTWRTFSNLGYTLGDSPRDNTSNSANSTANSFAYWSKDPNNTASWVYLYFTDYNSNQIQPGGGYGQPGNADRSQLYTTANNPKAPIRKFADTPQGKGH